MTDKVLVVGSNGLLGQKAVKCFSEKYEVVTAGIEDLPFTNVECFYQKLDITSLDQIKKVIDKFQPNLIFNAAAYTQVDQAEIDRDLCFAVNVTGAKNLANLCAQNKIPLIHISTDYVFDGEKGNYLETDLPNPLGYYGQTKFEGEQVVQDSGCNFIIGRTAVLYGYGVKIQANFILWALNSLKEEKQISVVDDQIGNPTIAENLAQVCLELIEKKSFGLFHIAGSEPIPRYHLAVAVANVFGLNKNLISRIKSNDFPQKAPRPMDVSLNISKVQSLNMNLLNVESSLRQLKEILSN
jgi:dTDP-4-dehydrorhamnose reductase